MSKMKHNTFAASLTVTYNRFDFSNIGPIPCSACLNLNMSVQYFLLTCLFFFSLSPALCCLYASSRVHMNLVPTKKNKKKIKKKFKKKINKN